ncbi:hypothetical protein DITRI_Ditri02bG0110200 [Diplodiscus trichospermus]
MYRLLLAVAVLATLIVSATCSNFDSYKLSLIWRTSASNTGSECKPRIPSKFTIHGLWPQDEHDQKIPPYDPNTNKCNVNPTNPSDILDKLTTIENELEQMWPSLRYNKDDATYWRTQWEHHGMCSEYPTDPKGYFDATLTLANKYDPLQDRQIPLWEFNHQTKLYQVQKILDNVKKKVGVYPQISCNMLPKVGTLQLREIRFCFEKGKPPTQLKDCPKAVDDRCTSITNDIRFPPPSPIFSTPNITNGRVAIY